MSGCSGFASYQTAPTGETAINGSVPVFTSKSALADIETIHSKYHREIHEVAAEYGLPAVWLYGFIYAEASRRDWDRSCSPCDANCGYASCPNNPVCPTTGQPACAYGLMQTIPSVAKAAGVNNPADLVGNPKLSLQAGAHLIRRFFETFKYNLPGIAASYLGGGPACRGSGVFGFGSLAGGDRFGRDDYAYRVTLAANTAARLGYGAPPSLLGSALGSPLTALLVGVLLGGALGYAAHEYGKLRLRGRRQ